MNAKKPTINFIFLDKRWKKAIQNLQDDASFIIDKATRILNQDFSGKEMSVVLTNNAKMHNLNKTFRHKDKPTNVLSFSSKEEGELGDIILGFETVIQEAEERKIPPQHHTLHLIVHGFLHLLGYDHENDKDTYYMESLEIQILNELNIPNPYEDI